MFSPNACEEKSVWDGLLSVSLEPQWEIWERSLPNKDFCSKAANSAQETIENVYFTPSVLQARKGHRHCCVRCRQTTKYLILRNCLGETKTGEARSNYKSRREMGCVHMAVGLEQRTRRLSSFHTSFSTLLP